MAARRLALLLGLAIASAAWFSPLAVAGPSLEPGEDRPGGDASSTRPRNRSAFSNPAANLSFEGQFEFKVGDGVFRKLWVSAPSSTTSSDGLGPLYNARSCQSCHLKDGRGTPPAAGEPPVSLLFALARPDGSPDPIYGAQLQPFAIQGHAGEATIAIAYREQPVKLADGTIVKLRHPTYTPTKPAYGPLDRTTRLSPRVAPAMIGVGLLELIPEADILARADPDDRDGDGIRGIARRVWSRAESREMLGRFGWKAGAATIADQAANAFANDMGLSTPLIHASAGDCTEKQAACRKAPTGDDAEEGIEVPKKMFDLVVFYSRRLAVPARVEAAAPAVLRGKDLFADLGCAACHTPRHVTGQAPDRPELSGQTIWPYSDLLLHDMGTALADPTPDGKLWRTTPLWGLGLTETVSGHTYLLHDGRARGILEAVLWHGGEAEAARERVTKLDKADREALLAFLGSL